MPISDERKFVDINRISISIAISSELESINICGWLETLRLFKTGRSDVWCFSSCSVRVEHFYQAVLRTTISIGNKRFQFFLWRAVLDLLGAITQQVDWAENPDLVHGKSKKKTKSFSFALYAALNSHHLCSLLTFDELRSRLVDFDGKITVGGFNWKAELL